MNELMYYIGIFVVDLPEHRGHECHVRPWLLQRDRMLELQGGAMFEDRQHRGNSYYWCYNTEVIATTGVTTQR